MRFRLALEAARAGAWEWEIGSNRTYWSPENYALMGLTPGSGWATYEEWLSRVHPEDREIAHAAVRAAVERKGDLDFCYRVVWPDGTVRWLRDVGRMMLDDDGGPIGMYGIQIDITEQHSLSERLRQAERMEAMGRVAGMIAHDFNNLLTVVAGNGEMLERTGGLDDQQQTMVREICRASERAGTLTNQLLAFGRGQLLQTRVVDMNRLITQRQGLLAGAVGESVAVTITLAAGLPCVRADAGQIEQALLNLVMNSRDAMPAGGTLDISTFESHALPSDLDVGFSQTQRWVGVSVRDSGIGMNASTVRSAFDPFFTTKPPGKGTGLGLPSVHGIITQSGGHVLLASTPGIGTTVTFYLPAVEDVEVPEQGAPETDRVPGGGQSILVVEDEPAIRELLDRKLRSLGYTVHAASSAEAALDLPAQLLSELDALITDVVLPGMSGPVLAEQLRDRQRKLAVVFMTGYGLDAFGRQELPAGAAVIHKPFSLAAMAREVRRVIAGR